MIVGGVAAAITNTMQIVFLSLCILKTSKSRKIIKVKDCF